MTTEFIPATSRQLWALYCITKKDYRNENLSKEDAAKLITELGNPNYKKESVKKEISLEDEFIEYFKQNMLDGVVASMKEAIGLESAVIEDTNFMKGSGKDGAAKVYKFRGFGCSISYLTYDKRSKLAKKIEEMFRDVHYTKLEKLVIDKFPKSLITELRKEGNPIEAIFSQDMEVNSTLYHGVVAFAKSKGVKNINYVTRLD